VIGVFDSGLGGLSVLRALRAELPREDFIYFSDTGHFPYGERGDAFVAQRSLDITGELVAHHRIKALVVACNTATAAGVHLLRERYPQLPVVGVEPPLKPAAALTRTGRVAVFATRGTLASAKFRSLHDALRDRAEFILQPCNGLAAAIESGDAGKIRDLCEYYIAQAGPFGTQTGQADTLVLGCTHYPFAAEPLTALLGSEIQLIETGEPVARQTRRLLEAAHLLDPEGFGQVQWETTGSPEALRSAASRWLGL